ncbi:MAG: hypothetical protein M1833_003810 [Piccolia ochrophora]|nr:MAG: hypothetical protein M1833_003810 [Piccolia ochrophora]
MSTALRPAARRAARHGEHIYVYSNIRTNQVVYSLTPQLDNTKALRQLPFLGKKTVPATLRKDIWHPMATISFPHGTQGLLAYQKLREYRRLHELSWPVDQFRSPTDPNQMMSKKQRGRKLMDQKANTVADIAAVLQGQEEMADARRETESAEAAETPETEAEGEGEGEGKGKSKPPRRRKGRRKGPAPERLPVEGVEGVTIRWTDILDAEYAESWPDAVVHDVKELERRGRQKFGY